MADAPAIVSFYRADSWRVIGRGFIFSAITMTLGAFSVAASILVRRPIELHETLFALGIALVVFGGLTTIVGFTRALRDETCVVARTDGLVLIGGGKETFVAWGDLAGVRFDTDARVVVLAVKDGAEHRLGERRYGDKSAPDFAKALDELRRKAEWNLLRA